MIDQQILTSRLELRRLRPQEAGEVFDAYASRPEVGRFLTWPFHRGILDTRQFLRRVDSAWKAGMEYTYGIRLKPSSQLIGSLGIRNDDGRCEIGYVLNPEFWGRGFATEACTEVVRRLKIIPEVFRIQSFVDAENHASARVLIKSGFVEEAFLPKWRRFINQGNVPKDCIQYRVPLG